MKMPDVKKHFFMHAFDCEAGGGFDLDMEIPEYFDTEKEAIDHAKQELADGNGQGWIIECRVIKRVAHGKPVVLKVTDDA